MATGGETSSAAAVQRTRRRSKSERLIESLELEGPLLRAPLKHYKKMIRATCCLVKDEINAIVSSVNEAADGCVSRDDAVELFRSLLPRLKAFGSKLGNLCFREHLQAIRFMARLDHIGSANLENLHEWNKVRLNRILVDYMLRMSYRDTATKLMETSEIQNLVDIEEIDEARKVISALENKELAPALAWCADNNYKLKKYKSKLELDLRLQEFVELVRDDNHLQAISYARKNLAPRGAEHMTDLKRVLVTLAFRSTNQHARCKVLFEPKQWDYLADQFKREFYKLYGMTYEPLLSIHLQAGLCALKTKMCLKNDCLKEDPLSQKCFRKLAAPLPLSCHGPAFRCYITGELMGPTNIPVILRNGYIYSIKAIRDMIKLNNGRVTCPRTGAVCTSKDIRPLYISD